MCFVDHFANFLQLATISWSLILAWSVQNIALSELVADLRHRQRVGECVKSSACELNILVGPSPSKGHDINRH